MHCIKNTVHFLLRKMQRNTYFIIKKGVSKIKVKHIPIMTREIKVKRDNFLKEIEEAIEIENSKDNICTIKKKEMKC